MHSAGYNDNGEAAHTIPIFEGCIFENIDITARLRNKEDKTEYCEAIEVS